MRDNVSHLPGAVCVKRGRHVKREHLGMWPAKAGGWVVMRDRWIPDGKTYVRNIETQTFSNRSDALRALRVQP